MENDDVDMKEEIDNDDIDEDEQQTEGKLFFCC